MPAALAATRSYQRSIVSLRAVTYADVTALWRTLDMEYLDATFARFAASVAAVVAARRTTAHTLAVRYLQTVRRQADAPGLAPTVPPADLNLLTLLAELRITSVIAVKAAMIRREPVALASRNALVRTLGVADKHVGDAGRDWIRAAVDADPACRGWRRRTLGTCDYCREQAVGEHVHEGEADFPRHPHCGCHPEPVYVGSPHRPIGDVETSISGANPGWESGEAIFRNNCGHSVAAFEMRMRGEAVVAAPIPEARIAAGGIDVEDFLSRWRTPDGKAPTLTQTRNVTTTQEFVRSWGEGGRGFIMVQWKTGEGHAFAAYVQDGKAFFVDPQTGQRYGTDIFQKVRVRRIWAVRSDDLTPLRLDDMLMTE